MMSSPYGDNTDHPLAVRPGTGFEKRLANMNPATRL